jgi:YfiH family protein
MMFDISLLPEPNEAFDWVQGGSGPALACRPLAAVAPHLFTTRHWPLGSPIAGNDLPEAWLGVAEAMQVSAGRLVRVQQVHGDAVVVADAGCPPVQPADIIVSCDPEVALAVQAADCLPLLLADSATGAVAAAHAGWRGLAAGVPRTTVASLAREFGSRAADLVAAIGPAIGPCCYEVGAEVRDRFQREGTDHDQLARWFLPAPPAMARNPSLPRVASRRADHWFFDTWTAARDQLAEAGVPAGRVFLSGLCTASHPGVFCSYRRDGSPAGRIAGAIRSPRRRP